MNAPQKMGPCGFCKRLLPRDELTAVNVHIYAPADPATSDKPEKIRIRACRGCLEAARDRFKSYEWDNDAMIVA